MRISDWSSDVCSSDLFQPATDRAERAVVLRQRGFCGDHGLHVVAAVRRVSRLDVAQPVFHHRIAVGLRDDAAPDRLRVLLTGMREQARADSERPHRFMDVGDRRSEEHTSELQSLMRISYAVFCLKKKQNTQKHTTEI